MDRRESTGEEQEGAKILPLERRAILQMALSYLEDAERELQNSIFSPLPPDKLVRNLAKIGIGGKSGELHVKLRAYKNEWEKELRENMAPQYPSFENNKSLKELLEKIDEQGGVEGSKRVYLAEELREKILNILGLRRLGHQVVTLAKEHEALAQSALELLPRTQDLRKTVDRLTSQEAPAQIARGARDLI